MKKKKNEIATLLLYRYKNLQITLSLPAILMVTPVYFQQQKPPAAEALLSARSNDEAHLIIAPRPIYRKLYGH